MVDRFDLAFATIELLRNYVDTDPLSGKPMDMILKSQELLNELENLEQELGREKGKGINPPRMLSSSLSDWMRKYNSLDGPKKELEKFLEKNRKDIIALKSLCDGILSLEKIFSGIDARLNKALGRDND